MKQKTEDILAWGFVVVVILLVVGGIAGLIYSIYQDTKQDKYCGDLFPSSLKEIAGHKTAWGEDTSIEEGWVRCCRKYAENHEIKQECEIFPYLNGEKQ